MNYPATLGRYLKHNCPEAVEAYSLHSEYLDGVEYCQLMGWLPEYGDPPTPDDVEKWDPPTLPGPDPLARLRGQLDALEDARAVLIRQLRAQVAVALIGNGWTQDDTMLAGQAFFGDHGPAIRAYIDGAAPKFAEDVVSDDRAWLELFASPGVTIREVILAHVA